MPLGVEVAVTSTRATAKSAGNAATSNATTFRPTNTNADWWLLDHAILQDTFLQALYPVKAEISQMSVF